MNGRDLADFEDSNYSELIEEFVRRNMGRWEQFVQEEYAQECMKAEARAELSEDR